MCNQRLGADDCRVDSMPVTRITSRFSAPAVRVNVMPSFEITDFDAQILLSFLTAFANLQTLALFTPPVIRESILDNRNRIPRNNLHSFDMTLPSRMHSSIPSKYCGRSGCGSSSRQGRTSNKWSILSRVQMYSDITRFSGSLGSRGRECLPEVEIWKSSFQSHVRNLLKRENNLFNTASAVPRLRIITSSSKPCPHWVLGSGRIGRTALRV
jgi:hypothetical protein